MLSLRPACRLLPRLACLVMGLVLGAAAPGTVASAETTKVVKPMEKLPAGFHAATAKVNGTTLYYRIGGKGSAVLLLHGYAETGHMWLPVMADLEKRHTVIVPDLRGAGASAKPEGGYDKKTMAQDAHAREIGRASCRERVCTDGENPV